MPVPTSTTRQQKNLWVAAGDGDLPRVRELVEEESMSPNAPDPFTYTPMHAAASYAQVDVLDYLISKGGDVNVTDSDGDTPLYVVESVEMAQYLVGKGAVVDRHNLEGISPAEHLSEDFPEVAAYLQALVQPSDASMTGAISTSMSPSQHAQHMLSEGLTDSLMTRVQDIMTRAEAEGSDPDEELRQVVGETVLEGMVVGYGMSIDGGTHSGSRASGRGDPGDESGSEMKRPRPNEE